MCALSEHSLSPEEYFALEETSDVRHEYCQGMIFAMTGASQNHNLVSITVASLLVTRLDESPCQPYPADFRLKIEAMNVYTYPDLSVVCGNVHLADGRQDTFTNPTVLIEVLSEGTEAYDRGKKFEFYRTIPSLQVYLLIAQDRPHIERYRRQGGEWILTEYSSLEDVLPIEAIGCTLPLAAIYKRVQFAEE